MPLEIEAYKDLHRDSKDWLMPCPGSLLSNESVAIGASSVQSAAQPDDATFVALTANGACFFEIGQNPTATTSSRYMSDGATRFFKINSGDKIAVIQP